MASRSVGDDELSAAVQCRWLFPLTHHRSPCKASDSAGCGPIWPSDATAPGYSASCPSEGPLASDSVEGREAGCTQGPQEKVPAMPRGDRGLIVAGGLAPRQLLSLAAAQEGRFLRKAGSKGQRA